MKMDNDERRQRSYEEDDDDEEEEEEEQPVCRICFGGSEEGRLISPCLCRGSIRFVHLECLHHWRHESSNAKAFYECGMCKYRYSFRRAIYAQILRSALVLHSMSLMILGILIVLSALMLRTLDDNVFEGSLASALKPNLKVIDLPKDAIPQEVIERFFEKTWFWGLTGPHLLLGLSAVGVVGWLCSFWLYAPLVWGPGRNRNILPILIIIGVIKVLTVTYEFMKSLSGYYLRAAENLILEVGDGYSGRPRTKKRRKKKDQKT
eukprot:jgi/Bigna1/139683/aug1.51_g14391